MAYDKNKNIKDNNRGNQKTDVATPQYGQSSWERNQPDFNDNSNITSNKTTDDDDDDDLYQSSNKKNKADDDLRK